MFLKGLAAPIQDFLVPLDLPKDLDSIVALAIRTDNSISQLRQQQSGGYAVTERTPLSQKERGAVYRWGSAVIPPRKEKGSQCSWEGPS